MGSYRIGEQNHRHSVVRYIAGILFVVLIVWVGVAIVDRLMLLGKPYECTTPKGSPIIGTPDFLIHYNDKVTVADGKTARDDSFQYIGPTQEELKKEKMQYYWQKIAYLYLMNKNVERLKAEFQVDVVEQGLVFFYNKENGIVQRELVVVPTKKDVEFVENRADLIWDSFQTGKPPACTCADGPWELEYCQYGDPATRVTNSKGKVVNAACCELDWVKETA